MELIEELKSERDKNGKLRKYGKFKCPNPICNKVVKKILDNGKKAKTCGCITSSYKHGLEGTRLYTIWVNIKQRILNLKNNSFKDYGGRGITICDEWLAFIPFRDWALSHGYEDNLEIDRKNTDGNYEPSNCRWITKKENSRKTRRIILTLEKANEIRYLDSIGNYTQKELAIKFGVHISTVQYIIKNKIWKN